MDEQGEYGANDPAEEGGCIDDAYIIVGEPKKDSVRWKLLLRGYLMMAKAPISPKKLLAAKRVEEKTKHETIEL